MAGRPRDERTAERFLVDVDEEKLRAQALLALVDAAPGAIDELGPDKGLPLICARLLRAMDCTTAVLSLVDFGRDTLESVVGYDVSGVRTAVRGSRALAVDAVAARVIGNREPLFAAPDPDSAQAPGPAAPFEGGWLALPLVLSGESVGMIELLAGHRERRYTTAELVLAQGVCATVAQAVADSQAFAKYLPPSATASGGDGGGRAGRGAGPHAAERTLVDIARRLAEGLEVEHCDVLIRMEGSGAVKVVARYRADGDQGEAPGEQSYGLGDVGRAGSGRRVAAHRIGPRRRPLRCRPRSAPRWSPADSAPCCTCRSSPATRWSAFCAPSSGATRDASARQTRRSPAQLAGEAGVAVESARVIDRLDSQNREQRLMLETGAAIASSVDLHATLSTITERLVQTLGVAWSDVYDYHAASGELEVIAYYQVAGVPSDPAWLGRRFSAESWPEGLATVDLRRPHAKYYDYSRLSFEDFASMAAWGEKATLSVPLVCGNEVFGVLDVAESRYPRRFTADEVRLAEAIGTQAALAIRNARAFDEAERRNADLATLLGVAATLTSAVDRGTVLAAIARHLREALRSTSAEVYQYDTGRRTLELVARDSDEPDAYEGAGFCRLSDDPLLAGCIDERRVVAVQAGDPVQAAQAAAGGTAQAAAGGPAQAGGEPAARRCTGSELWVPLVYQDEVLGLLASCDAALDRCYSQEEIGLATAIAAQAAAALQSARAYERLEQERAALTRLNARLSAFVELSGQMRGLLSEERLIDLLGRVLHETLEFNQWVIYLFDPDEQLFNVAKAFGGTPEIDAHYAATPIPARVMEGLIGSTRTISQSHFVDHLLHTWTDEENYFMPGEELVGERPEGEWNQFDSLFVPMLGQKGQLIGYIEAYDPLDRQRPNDDVVRLIEVFASKAASNIELQRAYGELEQQSRTDGLTGLYNHRFFQERLAAEVARAQRFEKPLTLLMIDVDNFKEYNDAFGHPQGDRLLKTLADLLLAQTRTNVDFVARYGGEEFVVLLLETGVR